jgi:hypothetical protein
MATKNPKVAQKIRTRASKWDKYWRINREQYNEHLDFVMGNQWKEDESKLFERYNKIPITVNKLGALANHMLGEQRGNTPQLQIQPDDSVPEKTAQVRSALIKNISLNSDTEVIYQHAYFCALIGGYGAFGVRTKYKDDYNFDQDIEVYKINDPTRAYWDVSAEDVSKIDGMSSGIRTRMSRKKFRGMYGKKTEKSIGADSLNEDVSLNFADDDSITIYDDYERKYDTVTIYELSNEKIVDQDEMNDLERMTIDDIEMLLYEGAPVTILRQRDTPRYKVKFRKIAGDFILEESDFTSQSLPIIFVDQNSYWDKNGQQICRPFFKDVKDTQRYLNYIATQSAYMLKVSRFDQFMVSRANVKSPDTLEAWRDPATFLGALMYDESPNGNKPERLSPPELSQSLLTQYDRALMDIQSGTGLYNTQLGEMGNEVSGRAIDARTQRGSLSTFVSRDSLNRAVASLGKVVNEMISRVYDTKRLMMLKMDDGNTQPVTLNEQADEYGTQINNDMTTGRYNIRLIPGLSYQGQKEQLLEAMQVLFQANPQYISILGDLYVENLPADNVIELRNRIRTTIPPEIIEAGKTGKSMPQKPQGPSPDQIMAQIKQQELQLKMQQSQQDAQFRMIDLNQKQQEIQRKAIETHQDITGEIARIENEKQETQARLQEQVLRYQAEVHKTNAEMQIQHGQNVVQLLTSNKDKPTKTE